MRSQTSPSIGRAPSRFLLASCCTFFAILGLVVAVAGTSRWFEPWNNEVARTFFGAAQYGDALPMVRVTHGIVGGSIVGKWVAALWLVLVPLRRGDRWAWRALWAGLLIWFGVDSAASLGAGATFNVWMINAAPLLVMGAMLARARPPGVAEPPPRVERGWRLLYGTCIAFAGLGLVVAFAMTTPVFAIYRDMFAQTYFDGTLPPAARRYLCFIAGPIGGTFAAQFAMLAWSIRCADRAGRRWVVACVSTSVLAWFVVDSSVCAWHGAWFNIAMINVPTLVALAPGLWLARRAQTRPQSDNSATEAGS